MKTLIELYDDSPIENVLATLVFSPQECVLLCPPEIAKSRELKSAVKNFLKHRGIDTKLTFIPVSMDNAVKIAIVMKEVQDSHQDCAINISGGSDAALFAAGAVAYKCLTPVFTYSRRKNAFFEINNASFARGVVPNIKLDVESSLLMAGGTLLPGRADNAELESRIEQIDSLFAIYGKYRRIWNRQISWFQKVSSSEPGVLEVSGPLTEHTGNGNVTVEQSLFTALAQSKLILDLEITEDSIRFRFPDETVRFWLRDVGAVLELQLWRACKAAGCFDDVVLSAIVNWQNGSIRSDSVTNEIDVMAVQELRPVFISCKACEVHTEALNELSILRERFGGKYSRAILATSGIAGSRNRASVRNRAAKLGIELIEWEDLSLDRLIARLRNQE